MKTKVTAIFDIGKTNKKCFLFDENFKVVYETQKQFDEIVDEDGFPCDDLKNIQKWIRATFKELSTNEKYDVTALNFSAYGASWVHIDQKGKPVTPLYNYLKPFPKEVLKSFYQKYGSKHTIAKETASPSLGMLNSGFQLYWLKYAQSEIFKKIRWSLHLPQYLSYLFTGVTQSDFTSIGCHTALWDFEKKDYHRWVYAEGIDRILPPIVSTKPSIHKLFKDKNLKIGPGIHDSSAALIPYLQANQIPFILISTGTWSISLNPFNADILTKEDLKNDCLNYMQMDGKPVKAARVFLGNEYDLQVKKLNTHFEKDPDYHRQIKFDRETYFKQVKYPEAKFHFGSIKLLRQQPRKSQLSGFRDFESAYHRLMIELMELQTQSTQSAIGTSIINKIFVDGGFADNELFLELLQMHFKNYEIITGQSPIGSALGAAMAVSDKRIPAKG